MFFTKNLILPLIRLGRLANKRLQYSKYNRWYYPHKIITGKQEKNICRNRKEITENMDHRFVLLSIRKSLLIYTIPNN